MGPGPSAVGAAVDAVADGDVAPRAGGAGPDVDDVGIGWRHRHRADGADREVVIGKVRPRDSGVDGLPHPATGRAQVEHVGLVRDPGDRRHSPAARGPHHPEVNVLENLGGHPESLGDLRSAHRPLRRGGGRRHGHETQDARHEVNRAASRRRPPRRRFPTRKLHTSSGAAQPTTASTSISTRYSSPTRSA